MRKIIILFLIFLSALQSYSIEKQQFSGLRRTDITIGGFDITQQYGTLTNSFISCPNLSGNQSFPLSFSIFPQFRDSTLNFFEIGSIPNQRVELGHYIHFYVKCDSLIGSKSYETLPIDTPFGKLSFNPQLQYFEFTPDLNDTNSFTVRFRSFNNVDTIDQVVNFEIYRVPSPDIFAFGISSTQQLPDPNSNEYQFLSTINNYVPIYFNGQNRPTRNVSVSGADLIFDNVAGNILFPLSNNKDITQLNIYADRLFIRGEFLLPQTEVNIYCRVLVFENGVAGSNPSINTTPITPIASIPGVQGLDGATGGNINIFCGQLIDNSGGIRFKLIGGDGQSATNARAGSGGNGGHLFSNLNILYKADYAGGIAGNYAGASGLAALKYKGDVGIFEKDSINLRWIHPNYIRHYISFCDDAFFLGFGKEILPTLSFYSELISRLSQSQDLYSINNYLQSDLYQSQLELIKLRGRILSGDDYFGNPVGWVPLLSFEFTKAVFDTELEHAMRILYLDYFIRTASDTLQRRIDGYTTLRDELNQRFTYDRNTFNNLVLVTVPDVENRIDVNNQRIQQIGNQIEDVMAQIARKAEEDLNRQNSYDWTKTATLVGQIATMVPYPPVQTAGAGIVAGVQFYNSVQNTNNINQNSILNIAGAASSAIQTYNGYQTQFQSTIDRWNNIGQQWQDFFPVFQGGMGIDSITNQINRGRALFDTLSSVYAQLNATYSQYLNVGDGELQRMTSDAISRDPLLATLHSSLRDAEDKHKELIEEYKNTNDQIFSLGSQIMAYGLVYDDANTKVLSNTKVLDHRTVLYINYLRENSIRRLKKYYYYMAKAYEFRTLQPFTGNLNLAPILNSVESMAIASSNSVLQPSQYATLAGLYESQVRQVAQNIYDYYISNAPAQTITSTYRLQKSDLDKLNQGEAVIFNPYLKGLFNSTEENIRIINIRVLNLSDSINPGTIVGNPARIDVRFEYPLVSNVRRNGGLYYFNNYNRNTNTPLSFSSRYDLNTSTITHFRPSASTTSLLMSLCADQSLPTGNEDLLMYSRPSADADLIVTRTSLNNSGVGELYIDSLLIEITYDFNTKPSQLSYLEIFTEPRWIVPNYSVSNLDINNFQNGQGHMFRAYNNSASNVTVNVEPRIGGYRFEKWTTVGGFTVPDADSLNRTRNFLVNQNYSFKVQYKWAGPILSLPDTLYFTNLNPIQNLIVNNIGEELNMYWMLDTLPPIASVMNGVLNGFGGDTMKINFSTVSADTLSYLVIIAPNAENGIDTVWLSYKLINKTSEYPLFLNDIRLYPNPANEQLTVQFKSENLHKVKIELFDVVGKFLSAPMIYNENGVVFNLNGIQDGVYFVRIFNKDQQKTFKFIKQNK